MTVIIIILAAVACIANFFMDEARHHYARFIGHVVPDSWDWWFNPAISHSNKYFSPNPVIRFVFMTLLVWTTDFWHFTKFVTLACFGFIVVLLENPALQFWQYGVEVLVLGVGWFIVWELTNGIVGAISDKWQGS